MFWILLAICVSFLKALWELIGKKSTDERSKDSIDEYALVFWARAVSTVLLLPLVFFIDLPEFSWSFIGILIISIVWNAITNVTSLKAVKYGELSIVWPLTALTLPFLLFSAYAIAWETTNFYGYIWVLLVFFGTYFLGIENWKKWFLSPIQSIYNSAGARYMVITALIWSITSPLDKLWVLGSWVITWMFLTNLWVSMLLWFYIIFFRKKTDLSSLKTSKGIKKVAAVSCVGATLVFMQMLALKYTLVIYVIAIKRASGIFSILLGYIFYKEKNIRWKLFAVAIMLAWVTLISILGNI